MTYLTAVMRTALVATALVAGTLASPNVALAATIQRFHADSGDSCRYGQTDGELAWQSTTPTAVGVSGSVIDRPLPTDPGPACPDDRLYTIAIFTGYAGTVQVDAARQKADNGQLDFRFQLGSSTSTARIDRVVIQVCRASMTSTVPVYCGPAQTYVPISTT